jgi:hypothetical protein
MTGKAPGALRGVEKINHATNPHYKGVQKLPTLGIARRIFSCHKIQVRRCLKWLSELRR